MALSDNLISYWSLDEASGDAVDAHGSNTLTHTNDPGTTTGVVSSCRTHNGSAEYFSIADNSSLSTGDIDFSVAGWVYFNSTTSAKYIATKFNAGTSNREYALLFSSSSSAMQFVVSNNGTSTTTATWGSAPSNSTWYFVAGGHNATSNDIWISVNAATPVTAAHTTGVLDGSSDFMLGFRPGGGGSDDMDGRMDEWGFWKRDIRSDLSSLYNSGSGVSYATIIGGGGGGPVNNRLIGGSLIGSPLIGGGLVRI